MTMAGDGPSGAKVTLNVYSGRPDPHWTLMAPEAAELLTKVKALAPAAITAAPNDNLGYRGFEVEVPGREADGPIVVGGGFVTLGKPGARRSYVDAGRGVESWLADRAGGHIDASTLKYVTDTIAKAR